MGADGGNQQNLTKSPNDDSRSSWSPDGERIAFASDRDGNTDTTEINKDSPKVIGMPHGLLMVNGLPLPLVGMELW